MLTLMRSTPSSRVEEFVSSSTTKDSVRGLEGEEFCEFWLELGEAKLAVAPNLEGVLFGPIAGGGLDSGPNSESKACMYVCMYICVYQR